MSSIHNVSAEDLARLFHHYHESLAHDFHGQASQGTDTSWEQAPQNETQIDGRGCAADLAGTGGGVRSQPAIFRQAWRGGLGLLVSGGYQVGHLYETLTEPLAHLYAGSCRMTLAESS